MLDLLSFPSTSESVRIFCYYHCRCSSTIYYNLLQSFGPKLPSLLLHAILATCSIWVKLSKSKSVKIKNCQNHFGLTPPPPTCTPIWATFSRLKKCQNQFGQGVSHPNFSNAQKQVFFSGIPSLTGITHSLHPLSFFAPKLITPYSLITILPKRCNHMIATL